MSHLDGVTWLAVCVSRCHMLSSPSPVCRGIGASRAARQGSTTKSRKAHACPVTRPALPVQVRAQVMGAGVRKCMKNFRAHGTEPFSVRLCVLKACLLLPHCGIRCRCRKMQPLCRRLLDGGVEVCALVQCRLLRHRAKPRDSWWAQDM